MSNQTQPETRKLLGTGRIAMIAALFGAVILVCFNIISSQVFSNTRVDLTQQHLYTLSEGTRMLLGELQEPVRFRFFMSSALTKQAPQLAAFALRVHSLLDSYVAAAKGKIILEVIDPRPFSEEEDRAVAFGIDGFNGAGGGRLFFGLAATNSTTGQSTIRVFAPEREAFLEYDLTRLVSELGRRGKPVVALLDGLGLAGDPTIRRPEQQVLTQMKQFFDVKPLSGEVEKLPDGTRVLMVVHPQDLSGKTLYTIDQWVLAGNATMIFVDPVAETQPLGEDDEPRNRGSNLETLFKAWGVKFDTKRAIGDLEYAVQAERNLDGYTITAQNPAWMALRGNALAHDEAILAQLSAVLMTTAGAFETAKDGVTLQPLMRASNAAVTIDAPLAGDRRQDPRRLIVESTKAPKPPILAARLIGMLDSAYPNGLKTEEQMPDQAKTGETKKDEGKAAGSPLKKSAKPANVILVGDADMLMDRNWVRMQSMAGRQVPQSFANNGDFVVNAIEQMSGGAVLSDLRGRGVSWRPFELIKRMEAEADSRFRAKERELMIQLTETEQKLSKLPKASGTSNEALTEEQANTIEGFRSQLFVIRSELRDVQFALRRDVNSLKNLVTALNVGIVPVTIGVVVLAFGMRRPRRPLPKKPST